jgi:DNA-binding NarL/FixJ family response regulator
VTPVIRVVVADDQALFRAGFRVLLEAEATWSWSGRRATGGPRSSWSGASCPTWS